MTTKDEMMFLKCNQQPFVNDNSFTDKQYSNLNLNKNIEYPSLTLVQSNNKPFNNKFCGSTVSDKYKGNGNSQSWKKRFKTSDFATLNNEAKDANKFFKTDSFSNNSTLSLHIVTYENSTEAVIDSSDDRNCKSSDSIKKRGSIKHVFTFASTFSLENPFEFPRQQNDKISEPEVSQFRASHRLANNTFGRMVALSTTDTPTSSTGPVLSLNPSPPPSSLELPFQPPPSPWLELSPDAPKDADEPCHYQLINRREKIHRIRPSRSFPAEITHVISPSEIWVRLLNHISDKLTISTNNAPILETNIVEGIYVFTPLNENILVRARVVLYDTQKKQALLRLIDHGKLVWRDENAVFEMKSKRDEMRKYPWQSLPITLQGVVPSNGVEWTDVEVEALKSALSDFPKHYVVPTCHELFYINNDNDYLRASIHAMTDPEFQYVLKNTSALEEMGHSVAGLYETYLSTLFPNAEQMMDYFGQKRYRYRNELSDTFDLEYQSFKIEPNPLPEPKNEFEDEENIEPSKCPDDQNDGDLIDIEQWEDVDEVVDVVNF